MNVYLYYVSAEWKIPSITDVNSNFATYQNNFLKIDYPENWIFTETTNSVTFAPERDSIDKIKSIIPGALPYEIFEQTLNRLLSS